MFRHALGATCASCLFVIAGVTALGAGGYMTVTGKTLCSIAGACGEKTSSTACTKEKTVTTVAAKEGETKSCCPLAKAAAAKAGACTSEATVQTVAANDGVCAKTCSGEKVARASRKGFYLMNGTVPVAMPAMFYNRDAKFCAASLAALKEAGSCNSPCTAEGKATTVAATEAASGCCQGKKAAAQTVAAKEGAPAGCCKGTGVRADGKPCQKDGAHCDNGEKTAESQPAQDTGKPVASRE